MRRRTRAWTLAVAVAGLASFASAAQDGPTATSQEELHAPIESCIRANAERVEQAFDSLIEATSFLVESVCLGPVAQAAEADRRRQRERYRAQLERICAEMETADPFSPLVSRYGPDCETLKYSDLEDELTESLVVFGRAQPPAAMIGLAASLLLDARLARETGGE